MNNRAGHLEEGDLLRLIDGELPEAAALDARDHIESCWSCRAHFQEIETAIGEYVRYQKTTDPWLPPPPNAWPELRFRSAPADSHLEPPGLSILPSRRWFDLHWALAAAAVLIAVFVVQRLRQPPAVSAAGLLRNAGAVESVNGSHGSIRITMRSRAIVRPALLRTAATNDDTDDVHLRGLFERAHFNWEQPLSPRTFAAWRDQLREKEDVVKLERGGAFGDAYVIRTSTRSSELHQATLTLRARDLRPMREMLEFTGETVEVEEAPEPVVPAGAEQIAASPAHALKQELSPESTLHRMLQVFSTLHRLGADLGEPVEIRQNAGNIEIAGTGLTAIRQQQLRAALENVPSVTVHFDSGAPRSAPQRASAKSPSSSGSRSQTRLETMLGSPQAAEDFTDRALDASDAVLARVHALRALAKAFPPAQEAALAISDRQLLVELRTDHVTALSQKIADLRSALQPVIGTVSRETGTPGTATRWQDASQRLFAAAQQLDEMLNRELASGATDGNGFSLISKALSRLDSEAAIVSGTHQ